VDFLKAGTGFVSRRNWLISRPVKSVSDKIDVEYEDINKDPGVLRFADIDRRAGRCVAAAE